MPAAMAREEDLTAVADASTIADCPNEGGPLGHDRMRKDTLESQPEHNPNPNPKSKPEPFVDMEGEKDSDNDEEEVKRHSVRNKDKRKEADAHSPPSPFTVADVPEVPGGTALDPLLDVPKADTLQDLQPPNLYPSIVPSPSL